MDVDLKLINFAQAQGLAGAQLLLDLSQSRISAGLSELETRLGVRLCPRGRSGFALTEAGRIVYDASHDLFAAVDSFCNKAGTVSARLKRVIKLGAVDALAGNREIGLPRLLHELRRAAPAIFIDLMVAGPEELEAELMSGKRDIIIVTSLSNALIFGIRRSARSGNHSIAVAAIRFSPPAPRRRSANCRVTLSWPEDICTARTLGDSATARRRLASR